MLRLENVLTLGSRSALIRFTCCVLRMFSLGNVSPFCWEAALLEPMLVEIASTSLCLPRSSVGIVVFVYVVLLATS